jgi:hypothetical protein
VLTLCTAAPSVHVPLHFLDISTFLCLLLVLWTTFPRFGLLSRTLPSVPLAPPVHIVPSLPTFPVLTLIPGRLGMLGSGPRWGSDLNPTGLDPGSGQVRGLVQKNSDFRVGSGLGLTLCKVFLEPGPN